MKRLASHKSSPKYIWQQPKWPQFTWNTKLLTEQLAKTRLAQGKLISKVQTLGFNLNQEAHAEILIEEAIKTAAVEGANLNAQEVRSSVARQLGLDFTGLPVPARSIDGLVQVLLDATLHYKDPLTLKKIKGWQAALFPTGYSGIYPVATGKWRGKELMQVVSGAIGREKIHYEAPPQKYLNQEMKNFLSWWKDSLGKTEGLIRAGLAHFYFVSIHPFEDGNGRIARAICDMAIAQDEKLAQRFYSLASQIMAERNQYYDILEASQKGNLDMTNWLLWFLSCMERAIDKSNLLIAKVMVKAKFWQNHMDMTLASRQRKVINRMLDLWPGNFGLTTRKYVALAKVSRATAYREITELLALKLLHLNPSKGRNVSYDLVL